jgi:uncharacterized protein with GYD domain
MPVYVSLMNLTEQGIKDIQNAPHRFKQSIEALEKVGGKLLAFYVMMGEYDYIGIAEAPSDEVAMAYMVGLGAGGHVRTTTMKAFTMEEFAKLVGEANPQPSP